MRGDYSRTPLFRSPKGNGKKFEIAGFRNNRGSVKFETMNQRNEKVDATQEQPLEVQG